MAQLLPSHAKASGRDTAGWLASTAIAALMVSGIAALALSIKEPGRSTGEDSVPILMMLPPTVALEAMVEPSPDVASEAAEMQPEPEAEDAPDTPELTEAPDAPQVPQNAPVMEDILAEKPPEVDSAVPLPVAPKKPEPKPEKKKEKKEKQAEKKPEKKKQEKKKSEEAVASAPAKSAPAAASAGSGSKQTAQNYAAQVMKKVSRTKKKRAGVRGTVVVAFSIASSGALASVSVARSSGQPALDQIAVEHIHRSAPFPPPPAGTKASYSFDFVAK